ncbi:amidohydrolase family protein [bacterium]|nr:amidohydrolase family protein [bacterium]
MSKLIIAGQLLKEIAGGVCGLVPGVVVVQDEVITDIIEQVIPASADAGGEQALICPGFIDAHLHLPQFDIVGAHGLRLMNWLSEVTFPAEERWDDPCFAADMTRWAAQQLLASGTTAFAGYATVHHDATRAAMKCVESLGMKAAVGQVLMNRNANPALCRSTSQLLQEAASLADAYPPDGRVEFAVTPRFAIACTDDLLVGAGALAAEKRALIQTHLAETIPECQRVSELFDGEGYVDVYRRARLLTKKSVLAHCIHMQADDMHALSETNSVAAHCPVANSFLGAGSMNRSQLQDCGVRLALGSDIGAGYERSMVRVARAMIETAAAIGADFPTAAEAWHRITAGNSDALGWPEVGRLRVGASADLLVVEPDIPWLTSRVDPLAMLMFGWDDRWIRQTMVRGKSCFRRE